MPLHEDSFGTRTALKRNECNAVLVFVLLCVAIRHGIQEPFKTNSEDSGEPARDGSARSSQGRIVVAED